MVSVSFGCGQCSHNFCYLVIGLQSLFLISVFIDQMVFVERLSSGHELLSKRTAELLSTLSADPRVHGAIPQTVAERREWAAALSWLDTKKPLLADLQALSATDIGTLGSIFELGPGKKPQQLCLLVHAFLSDNDGDASQDASFGEMLERHDSVLHGQIARWGLPKLQSAMKNAPSAYQECHHCSRATREIRFLFMGITHRNAGRLQQAVSGLTPVGVRCPRCPTHGPRSAGGYRGPNDRKEACCAGARQRRRHGG